MRSFVFFGRLVTEKGFDLLIPVFQRILREGCGIRFAVFGEGPLRENLFAECSGMAGFRDCSAVPDDDCVDTFSGFPSWSVTYFGKRKFSVIRRVLKYCDVSFMPSTFLETFGLSALESLSCGVPVAGFSKGGIAPFLIDPRLRLPDPYSHPVGIVESSSSGFGHRNPHSIDHENFRDAVLSIANVPDADLKSWKAESLSVSARYGADEFRKSVSSLLPDRARKILLLTDFESDIGGIETYVRNLAETLRSMGYEIRILGKRDGFSTKSQKMLSTLAAYANFRARKEIRNEITGFRPDVIWCHSVLRRIGPIGLDAVLERPAYRIMTYHDLGYFAPFAAECYRESDVPDSNLRAFVRAAGAGVVRKAFATTKYFKLRGIFRRLSAFDLHLVPSDFLLPIVRTALPKEAKVKRLSHYVPETCPNRS